jgi:hypothetical protein
MNRTVFLFIIIILNSVLEIQAQWQKVNIGPAGGKVKSVAVIGYNVFTGTSQNGISLVNKNMDAGSYNISWNASKMASGVYFYRLQVNSINNNQTGNFIETKKMMLIR